MPKKTEGEAQEIDPLGLWTPPKPNKPKGPNVYTLNLGRAIDMLRNDYPKVFTEKPDFSIFRKDIELHDPSGKRLTGLSQYEKVFDMLRFLRRTTMQDAQVTYRLVVADERIRVRWTAKLWMRDPALGITTTPNGDRAVVHLDGVSNYDLDSEGKIRKHTIENIILRGADAEAAPMELQLAWPKMAGALSPELALPYPFLTPLNEAAKGWVPPKGLAWLVGPAPTHEQSSSSSSGAEEESRRRAPDVRGRVPHGACGTREGRGRRKGAGLSRATQAKGGRDAPDEEYVWREPAPAVRDELRLRAARRLLRLAVWLILLLGRSHDSGGDAGEGLAKAGDPDPGRGRQGPAVPGRRQPAAEDSGRPRLLGFPSVCGVV